MSARAIPGLELAVADESGRHFETGVPVTFRFVKNTEKAPHFGDRYGQDIEPAGSYMLHNDDPRPTRGWVTGEQTFECPLVIPLSGDPEEIYGPTGWKARLHQATRKKGAALSRHLESLGYDGIVTVDPHGDTREIVALRRGNANANELTYGDFRRTGTQDCQNVFDLDDFDLDAGDIGRVLASGAFDEDAWIEQVDDFEGLDPHRCFEAWKDGYSLCARPRLEAALDERRRGLTLYYVTDAGDMKADDLPKPPIWEESASEQVMDQFDEIDDAVVALAKIPQGRILMGDGKHGPDDVILWVERGHGHLGVPWYTRDVAGFNDREMAQIRVLFSTTRDELEKRGWKLNPAAKISPLIRALFVNNSVTSRMLRALMIQGGMLQADFMREYHRISDRGNDGRSSFDNNFGRFVVPDNAAMGIRAGFYFDHKAAGIGESPWRPLWVIERQRSRRGRGDPGRGARLRPGAKRPPNMLTWVGPTMPERGFLRPGDRAPDISSELLPQMTAHELDASFEALEYEMVNPRATDDQEDLVWWVNQIRGEIEKRRHTNGSAMKDNPPWLTKAVAGSFEDLEGKVKPAWLPRLEDVKPARGGLAGKLHELGCGAYGCVLPTLDPKVVLKATTDVTEAQFAETLARDLVVPVTVAYHQVTSLPAKRNGRRIYLLWREEAKDVGGLKSRAAVDAINIQHELAQAAFDLIFSDPKSDKLPGALAAWRDSLQQMAEIRELAYLGNGMLEVYDSQHIFFGDIHPGNVGRCMRDGKLEWVITDPGHVAVVGSKAPRKALKNPARSKAEAIALAKRLLVENPDPAEMHVALDILQEADVSLRLFTEDDVAHVGLQKADVDGDDATGRIKLDHGMEIEWLVVSSRMPAVRERMSQGYRGGAPRREFEIYWAARYPWDQDEFHQAPSGGVKVSDIDPFAGRPVRTRANRPFALAHAARLAWEMAALMKASRYEGDPPAWLGLKMLRLSALHNKDIPNKYKRPF